MSLNLPADLVKGELRRSASTPAEYWNLVYRGYEEVDGPATADVEPVLPFNESGAAELEEQHPDEDPTAQAGDAVESDDA